MSHYRTHFCGELRLAHQGKEVLLSGFVHRKRDHGGLVFIDLRDHYGIVQCVFHPDTSFFKQAEKLRNESIITVRGKVVSRDKAAINPHIETGEIEVSVDHLEVLFEGQELPLPVNMDTNYNEEIRLKYRYLDLRRPKMHNNIVMRSKIIQSLRHELTELGFLELQTPILTGSSPEGARDYLVPSRHHPGKFYALPQAPQQFKQLYMISGFDKYFQIAPCFRDEDARADRSPGEFYQLDLEMAFVEQDDVLTVVENVLYNTFKKFAQGKSINDLPFPRLQYKTVLDKYGSDKPDLRNPLTIANVTDVFKDSDFSLFAKAINERGSIVRGIGVEGIKDKPRSFFDGLNDWARSEGAGGLGYIIFDNNEAKGPIAKFLTDERIAKLKALTNPLDGGVFFICDMPKKAIQFSGVVRQHLGKTLDIIKKDVFEFCWVTDFPMYEENDQTGGIDFSHNPFSMPQGGLDALNTKDPLDILAYQYDIVCNGIELSSGAIRNHKPEIMYKAFEIAGYKKEDVDKKFTAMINAFKFGAPPHGGCAPGIDRMVMLILDEENIREIIAFPFNQQAQDLMLSAPSDVDAARLAELHLAIKIEEK